MSGVKYGVDRNIVDFLYGFYKNNVGFPTVLKGTE
jgi:hypothetical protein